MANRKIRRHRTAIGRTQLSRPVRFALEANLLSTDRTFFDYGCGRGSDIARLRKLGIQASGWDPAHRPEHSRQPADVVNLGYVLNVIENRDERKEAISRAWELASRLLVVAVRLQDEDRPEASEDFGDGFLTSRDTFQKFYGQREAREWIDEALCVTSVAAAPGVFFVFREEGDRHGYLAQRYQRRRAAPKVRKSDLLFDEHRELLQPLIEFISSRGRLPASWELAEASAISEALGSLKRAFALIRRVTGNEQWDQVRVERYQELLIVLALARFAGRPRFGALPEDLRLDVREYFSSYKNACALGDELLFSAGDLHQVSAATLAATAGKRTGNALYVHRDWLHTLPPLLRVYEGCARAYAGNVESATIVKLHRTKPQVSYLEYPDFDRDPHPALRGTTIVRLQELDIERRSYDAYRNPFVLHRKEEFIDSADDRWTRFERLTRQEERWGLFGDATTIGTRDGWEAALASRGAALRGHRLIRSRPSNSSDDRPDRPDSPSSPTGGDARDDWDAEADDISS